MAQNPQSNQAGWSEGFTKGEAFALVLAVVWALTVGVFFLMSPPATAAGGQTSALHWIAAAVVVFAPVACLWGAVSTARTTRMIRAEFFRLQSAIDGLRQMQLAQKAYQPANEPTVDRQLAEIVQSTKKTESVLSGFASRREVSRLIVPRAAPQSPADQPALALGTSTEDMSPPLERPDLIQALNFPNDEHDTEGFAALRRALRDRSARRLVQASQDVLTLLSQDGIYMDDLRPDPVSADLWRRFAGGERGKDMDRLGGIRDRASLALIAGRMREDTIFRDAVHHFLRRFDEMLVTFEDHATDTDLLELAETRTTRAFMLLARATGTFD